jgi:hypothetical protein
MGLDNSLQARRQRRVLGARTCQPCQQSLRQRRHNAKGDPSLQLSERICLRWKDQSAWRQAVAGARRQFPIPKRRPANLFRLPHHGCGGFPESAAKAGWRIAGYLRTAAARKPSDVSHGLSRTRSECSINAFLIAHLLAQLGANGNLMDWFTPELINRQSRRSGMLVTISVP